MPSREIALPVRSSSTARAARLVNEGDTVIILTYTDLPEAEARSHRPKLVYVDGGNRVTHTAADLTAAGNGRSSHAP